MSEKRGWKWFFEKYLLERRLEMKIPGAINLAVKRISTWLLDYTTAEAQLQLSFFYDLARIFPKAWVGDLSQHLVHIHEWLFTIIIILASTRNRLLK